MKNLTFDPHYYSYPSQRMMTVANRGMVNTSQPLAAQAGLDILKKGGNAIDAAIATAATLTVVEPTSNGLGGDAFALVWTKGELHGLNASGPAPSNISIDKVRAQGYDHIPKQGWIPVTVPGAPAGWAALSKRFGKLSLKEALEPAISYATNGYPLSPVLAYYWKKEYEKYLPYKEEEQFKHWFKTFARDGSCPKAGDIWKSPDHAKTLTAIAETDADTYYNGEIADKIDAFSKKHSGFLSKQDLAGFQPEWVDPIHVNYRGYDVWEIPPNGQGLVALLALNMLNGFDFAEKDAVSTYHKQIEAMKLAFADGKKYITEQKHMDVNVKDLLSNSYAAQRRSQIKDEASIPEPGTPPKSGTVYLATADQEGNMVSFIQSNYDGFGSGLVVPGTGIALQNRGCNFSLDPEHDNALQGGKRTYHTIIPGFLTKDNQAVGPFGVMGGFMQPQGHVQVIMNTIDFHLNPQASLDAPRWHWSDGKRVLVEPDFPRHLVEGLERVGHQMEYALDKYTFGRGQIIWRDPETGVLFGGTEKRTDGTIAAY